MSIHCKDRVRHPVGSLKDFIIMELYGKEEEDTVCHGLAAQAILTGKSSLLVWAFHGNS